MFDLLHDTLANRRLLPGLMVLILVAGMLGAGWLIVRTEYEMREDLLGRVRLAAKTVHTARIRALTGSDADLESADYQLLKEQFAAIRTADPNCRFIYLLGRKADGSPFIFVDSEPVHSKDYSPPGQAYAEMPVEFQQVFETRSGLVVGPIADRWGTWVSALVPLTDPQSGVVIAVLGMDIDARDWKWDVAYRAARPVGVTLLLLVGLLTALFAVGRAPASPKPVMRRLLPFLTVIFLALVAGSAFLHWRQHYNRVVGRTGLINEEVEKMIKAEMEQQASIMSMVAKSIALDSRVLEALSAKDAERLQADWRNLFATLHQEQSLTHFLFYDENQVCVLRLHKPELRGDKIERFLPLQAERTGKPAWGIEMGKVGTATLRIVQPVFEGTKLLGYIELGKAIEVVMGQLQVPSGLKIAISIKKELIQRAPWEAEMNLRGRESNWEHLPHSVIVYASSEFLPEAAVQLADYDALADNQPSMGRSISAADGKHWSLTVLPFADASGKDLGAILMMNDISGLEHTFYRDITIGGMVSAIILAVLIGLSFVMLRRTDAGICAQQAQLRKNEELLAAILRSIGDGVIACNTTGQVVNLNAAAEQLTGWTTAEASGRPIREVFRIVNAQTREEADNPVFRAISAGENVDLANHTALIARDGTERQIADCCAPVRDASGVVLGAVLVFRDVTAEYSQREELRQSEERFKQLAAQSRTITWEVNAAGLYTFVSDVVKEVLGYDPEELVGTLCFYDLHPEGEREEFKAAAFEVFSRQEPFHNLANRISSKTGETYWFSTNGIPLLNPDGTLRGYRGSDTDISAQKRVEAELESERLRLAGTIGGTHVGTWEWNVQTGETVFNERWAEIIGYSLEEISPVSIETWEKYSHPDDLKHSREQLEKHFRGELDYYDIESRMRHRNGEWVWVLDRGKVISWTKDGKPLLMLGTHQDITESKRMQAALLKANEQFALAVNGSNDGIWDWNMASGEVYLSPRWKQMLGYEDQELKNCFDTFINLVFADDLVRVNEYIQRYLKGEMKEYALQFRMKHKDGSLRWVLSKGAAIRDKENRPFRMAGSQSDITEQKQAEDAIKYAKEQAEAASKAKSEFLANMSHEIRTPLNGVIGFTDLLRNTPLSPEQQLYVENANVSGHALLNIITDILDFSKIEAGMMTLETLKSDLFLLFEQSVDIVKFDAERKKLEILLDLDIAMPRFAMVDRVRLNQVLINLLGNAVKFTEKGEVELKVRYTPLAPGRGTFSISVRDTGIGITAEQKDKLFKAFSQADASTTRKFGGTGLGLIISDMVVRKMGGKIQVESVAGEGSTFFFNLTLDIDYGETGSHENISPVKRCLIIDDNANNRRILEHMLANWDIACESSSDGLAALKILELSQPFDIIVCDYNMPNIDGLETICRIWEKLAPAKPPVILLYSSSDGPEVHKKCADLDVRFCIPKPVKQEQLLACFAAACESARGKSRSDGGDGASMPGKDTLREHPEPGPVILVAEDVHVNLMLTKALLSRFFPSMSILEAGNGQAAIRKYRECHPDLILMDVQMPEMDGLAAAKAIRQLERSSGGHVPIIALSAATLKEERENCYQAGMDDFITKPVEAKKLQAILVKYLPGKTNAVTRKPS